ncbi:MAG: pitrilysin family protein [Hydrogenovibrio sp.]|nr:pitrilysin family protein [Hydrogenovibrio sp.]
MTKVCAKSMMAVAITGVLLCSTAASAKVDIQHWQTQDGSRVFFVHAPQLPMVDVEVRFDAGSARDGQHWGQASLTAALIGTSTAQMNEEQISSAFNHLGAQFSSDADRDSASIHLRSLTRPAILKSALSTFSQVVSGSKFQPAILERERNRLMIALKQRSVQPSAILSKHLWHDLYGNHPYGHPVDGTLETVPKISAKMLEAFYQRYYVARNAQVSIVGNVTLSQAKKIAEQVTSGLPVGQKPAPLPSPALTHQAKKDVIPFKSTQTYYALSQIGIQRGEPDYAALFVGNHLLGGSGFGSLLMENVREKRGLVYSVYSYFAPMKVSGPFLIGLSTKNATAKEADQVVRQTLEAFLEGFSDSKLQAIKDNLIGGFPLRMDNNSKILGYISMIGFYHLPLDYLEWFPKQIAAVSKEDILKAWRKHVHPDKMVMVMVGQPK